MNQIYEKPIKIQCMLNELCKNQHNENHPLLISTHKFLSVVRHFLSSFSETGTQYLHLMLVSTGEFHEDWHKGGCIFLMRINVIIYFIYQKTIKHFLSKECLLLSWSTALEIVHLDKAATSGMADRMCRNH
jgi:hypothetical protein